MFLLQKKVSHKYAEATFCAKFCFCRERNILYINFNQNKGLLWGELALVKMTAGRQSRDVLCFLETGRHRDNPLT